MSVPNFSEYVIVGAGIHPRGYTYKMAHPMTGEDVESEAQVNMVDLWASIPYPIGDRAILQAGCTPFEILISGNQRRRAICGDGCSAFREGLLEF